MRRKNRKALKNQAKVLKSMKDSLEKLRAMKSPHSELVGFLTTQFEVLLNTSMGYVQLLNTVTDNYANCIRHSASTSMLQQLTAVQEEHMRGVGSYLREVIKRVRVLVRVGEECGGRVPGTGEAPDGVGREGEGGPEEERRGDRRAGEEVCAGQGVEQQADSAVQGERSRCVKLMLID